MANRVLHWAGGRVIRWLGWQTLMSLILLSVALTSVAWALAEVVQGLGFFLILAMALGGVCLGWVLAAAKPLPGWLAALLATIFGLEIAIWHIGRLGGTIIAAGQALTNLLRQLRAWPATGPVDTSPLLLAIQELGNGLAVLWLRWFGWVVGLVTGSPVFDPIATTLVWSLALWAVAVWAGWAVRRLEQPLLALTPAGALLATTLSYTLKQVGTLLPVIGATLLLIGLVGYHRRERRWRASHIDYASSIEAELAVAFVIISLVLTILAGSVPSISVRQIARLVQQKFQVEAVTGSFGLRAGSNREEPLSGVRAPGLPRGHLLGAGPELSEQVALVVTPVEPVPNPDDPPRYYWRSLTYDRYTGRGWRTNQTETANYEAGQPVESFPVAGRQPVRQEIRPVGRANDLLFAAGELVSVNHNYQVHHRHPGDLFAATVAASTYQVDSLIPAAGKAALRTAGAVYPDWVASRYLSLPETVPARVLVLARDLTATALTPYDRAKAIETYLRTFPYTLDLPEPPSGPDMADYFLFDLQQGYCDYYATSMVVLARASGLPARLAVGYIGGTYDSANGRYIVTEAEAHSWPEIYFPNYGWVNFEPTGGRPVLERPEETELASPTVPPDLPEREAGRIGVAWGWLALLPAGLVGLLLVVGAWIALDGWLLRRLPPPVAVTRLYRRLHHHGRRLAVPTAAGDTPYEFTAALARSVAELSRLKRGQKLLSPAPQEIGHLTNLYVQSCYSSHPPDSADQTQVVRTWQRLRLRLWLAWLWYIIPQQFSLWWKAPPQSPPLGGKQGCSPPGGGS